MSKGLDVCVSSMLLCYIICPVNRKQTATTWQPVEHVPCLVMVFIYSFSIFHCDKQQEAKLPLCSLQ